MYQNSFKESRRTHRYDLALELCHEIIYIFNGDPLCALFPAVSESEYKENSIKTSESKRHLYHR